MEDLKGKILTVWLERVLDTYHPEAKKYILSEKDEFLNPIGSTYRCAIREIIAWLFEDTPVQMITPYLSDIIKIGLLNGYSPGDRSYSSILQACLAEFESEITGFNEIRSRITMLSLEEERVYKRVKENLEYLKGKSLTPKIYEKLRALYG